MARAGASSSTAPPQSPPPMTRGRSAARGRRLALAAEAAVCFYRAALCASAAALIATRPACGEDSRAAAAAEVNFAASVGAMALLHLASLLLHRLSPGSLRTDDGELLIGRGGDDPTGPAATQRRRRPDARLASSFPGFVFLLGCMLLVPSLVMLVLVPAKGSWMERVCSMLHDVGLLLHCLTYCFVKFPAVLAEIRATYAKLKRGTTGLHGFHHDP